MSLEIRVNSIGLGAAVADPLLVVAMLPPEVLLDPDEVAQGVAGVVVQARRLGAHEHPLPHYSRGALPLQELPRHLVPPPVHL